MQIITNSSRAMAVSVSISELLLLIVLITTTTTTQAFGIVRPTWEGIQVVGSKTRLEVFSFHSATSLMIGDAIGELPQADGIASDAAITAASEASSEAISDQIGTASDAAITAASGAPEAISDQIGTASDAAITAASEVSGAFSDKIDLFGDPTVRTLFLVFGGVVVVLAGLSVLSQKVDAAVENVLEDFESVLRTNPEFQSEWRVIKPKLDLYDDPLLDAVEAADKRKQKLYNFMEEMEEKDPAKMKRINAKIEALNNTNS